MQDLDELQAYILVRRWNSTQASVLTYLSSNQLQELEATYFLQRSYLLRSIEELLMQPGPNKQYAQCTAKAARQALSARLELNLCQALTKSFRRPSLHTDHQHKHNISNISREKALAGARCQCPQAPQVPGTLSVRLNCNGQCVDVVTDPYHCGGCDGPGTVCSEGYECSSSK